MLDAELAPGTPLADVLPIADEVLELEITPNRPDCLGVYGVARELHAATGAPLAPTPWSEDPGSPAPVAGAEVVVECPELCPRFTARVFEDVTIAPSPPWLKARLSAAGQRPINNVVDITNYAMLLTGQPLHAFDLDRVAGRAPDGAPRAARASRCRRSTGRRARSTREMVVIEDAEGPTSIAGLMGGARSEVQPDTTRVLLEVANWNGPNIHRTSWALGLRSEASARFEKGLRPSSACTRRRSPRRLMVELCGATRRCRARSTSAARMGRRRIAAIRLREARVRAILGMPDPARAPGGDPGRAGLRRPAEAHDGLDVTVPALRREDVTREVDLIEEVARIDGLERLPATLPARRGAVRRALRTRSGCAGARRGRAGRAAGCTRSSAGASPHPSLLDRLRLDARRPACGECVASSRTRCRRSSRCMRPTLLGSLLDAAAHNVARDGPDARDLRVGHRVTAHVDAPSRARRRRAPRARACCLPGALHEPAPGACPSRRAADFFAAKALLGALLERLRVRLVGRARGRWPFLHPGRSAAVLAAAGEPSSAGLGRAAPARRRARGICRAHSRVRDRPRQARSRPRPTEIAYRGPDRPFPPLRQDLAVMLPEEVPAAAGAGGACARPAGELLDDVARVRRLQRRAGGGGPALAGAGAVLPRARIGRSPTRTSRRCASGSSPRSAELGGELRG